MTKTTYTYSVGTDFAGVQPDRAALSQQIAEDPGVTVDLFSVEAGNGAVNVVFVDNLPAAEKTALDALVASHPLWKVKAGKYLAIDTRTIELGKSSAGLQAERALVPGVGAAEGVETEGAVVGEVVVLVAGAVLIDVVVDEGALIEAGFAFGGKVFSLSLASQVTLLGLDQLRNDPALVYPVVYNTLKDDGTYDLANAATIHGFVLTAIGTYRAHKDTGTALKNQVRLAATIAAVEAVVDAR